MYNVGNDMEYMYYIFVVMCLLKKVILVLLKFEKY